MKRKMVFNPLCYIPRFLAQLLIVAILSSCASVPFDVAPCEPVSCTESILTKRDAKTLKLLRNEVDDLRSDIKGLRNDIKKVDWQPTAEVLSLKRFKTFGVGCLTGVVISGLFFLFSGQTTTGG